MEMNKRGYDLRIFKDAVRYNYRKLADKIVVLTTPQRSNLESEPTNQESKNKDKKKIIVTPTTPEESVDKDSKQASIDKHIKQAPIDKHIKQAHIDKDSIVKDIKQASIDKDIKQSPIDKDIKQAPIDKDIKQAPIDIDSIVKDIKQAPIDEDIKQSPIDIDPLVKDIKQVLIDKEIKQDSIDKERKLNNRQARRKENRNINKEKHKQQLRTETNPSSSSVTSEKISNRVRKRNDSHAMIYVDTNMSTPWTLFNPGPWKNIATDVLTKYQIGLSRQIKMKYTPEQCFKMAVSQIERARRDLIYMFVLMRKYHMWHFGQCDTYIIKK